MTDFLWWRDGVIYQIYPRSFMDSNADGIGDLPGIIHQLDYVRKLGVDAIWLSPIYPSPDVDFGYDVSDYCAIDPKFGSMQDFEELLDQAHDEGASASEVKRRLFPNLESPVKLLRDATAALFKLLSNKQLNPTFQNDIEVVYRKLQEIYNQLDDFGF